MLSSKYKKNAPIIADDFDFGMMPSGQLLDNTIDINHLRKQCMSDPENGKWAGYVLMKVITDRFRISCPLDAPLFYYYVEVDY